MTQLQLRKKHEIHWVREITIEMQSRGQCNKTSTNMISLLFPEPKTIATIVNYTCKSFIKLTPGMLKTGLSICSGGIGGREPGRKGKRKATRGRGGKTGRWKF